MTVNNPDEVKIYLSKLVEEDAREQQKNSPDVSPWDSTIE